MDSKITKKRLSNFLSYEWIVIIIVSVALIFALELIYGFASVKLCVGQEYKILFDYNVLDTRTPIFNELKDKKAFSYDILETYGEPLIKDNDMYGLRTSVQDVDILITGIKDSLAELRVDDSEICTIEEMYDNAKSYLRSFLKDEFKDVQGELELDYNNLDEQKIIDNFNKRLGKDNRFRTQDQKQEGYKLEKQRIEKLCYEVKEFKKIVELDQKYFFNYRRYTNRLNRALSENHAYDINMYTELWKKESECRYGIRVDLLAKDFGVTGKKDVTALFQSVAEVKEGQEIVPTAEGVVIMTLDFNNYQYDYQHESISVINTLVRAFTNLLG